MKVVVLAGGLSDERDVSWSSGAQILKALEENGHEALLLDVFLGLPEESDFSKAYEKFGKVKPEAMVSHTAPDLEALKAAHSDLSALVGPNVISLCQSADAVFLALHGGIGENGQIQALLDLYHIPYTGSGYKGSALAMDKILAKKLVALENIPTPDYWIYDEESDLAEFLDQVTYPCVVKPLDNGSSIGIQMVDELSQMTQALMEAKEYSAKVLVEKKVLGREFSVGVIEGVALPLIEIIPLKGFYDYANKYQAGATKEVTPAELDEATTKKMQELAVKSFKVLELSGYCRVDFMLGENKDIQFIEANTLPGMTPTSLLPQEAQVVGINYNELCEKLLATAFKK